jgi:hypothetical protein
MGQNIFLSKKKLKLNFFWVILIIVKFRIPKWFVQNGNLVKLDKGKKTKIKLNAMLKKYCVKIEYIYSGDLSFLNWKLMSWTWKIQLKIVSYAKQILYINQTIKHHNLNKSWNIKFLFKCIILCGRSYSTQNIFHLCF